MTQRTLTFAAAIVAAGLIGFGSPLAATAMDRGMHEDHHHDMDVRHHHRHHHDYMASCYARHGYYGDYGYRRDCRPMGHRHMGYGGYGYMHY